MNVKKYNIEIFILTSITFLLFYSSEPIMYSDSVRYVDGDIRNPPLYSYLITVMDFTFGSLNSIIILQTLLIALSIVHFLKTVTACFDLDFLSRIIISLFLLIPSFDFYNHLLTEPLGYAFSLLLVSFVIKLIYEFNRQNLAWITVLVILLLLLRNQFIFLYPVILFLYIGVFVICSSKKKLTMLIVSFLSIFIIHNCIMTFYKHGHESKFKNEILSMSQGPFRFISIDAIYISTIEDVRFFKNKDLQKALTKIFEEMNKQEALFKYYDNRGHFASSFRKIDTYTETLLSDFAMNENTTTQEIRKKISMTLIEKNFSKYIKLIFKKFYDSTWLFVIVPFSILIAALINFFKSKSNFSLTAIFLSIFTLTNHSLVYLFGRVQPRYLIYTDLILLVFIFISFSIFLKKSNIK